MAKRLGIKTLVEGVETREQADYLASIGCDRRQGFYYGKPQPLGGYPGFDGTGKTGGGTPEVVPLL